MTSSNLPDWAQRILANDPPPPQPGPTHWASYHNPIEFVRERARLIGSLDGGPMITVKKAVPRPTDAQIQRKLANFKLVADALEFLLQIQPTIPGASVTLTPAQQDELQRIVLALPASVEL